MNAGTGWDRAREVFLDVADAAEAEREAVLASLADEDPAAAQLVRKLLRHDTPPPPERSPPRRLGPYELIRRIGAGGMGEVFMARRADGEYEREVAIKLLRSGATHDDQIQRFLRERQTLASLDHEFIARLLDGGTGDDGTPFLVMEFIEGEPADEFAARLEVRERLELFLRIGEAVAHAHERGVVHRDLKPSNILVRADGTPRLLDFGIARTRQPDDQSQLTRTGHRMFTPDYASPEQIRGEVATTSSDVFALGVLLHHFLTGRSPWPPHQSLGELERSICSSEPPPPSRALEGTARRRIAGDLDAITLQCLARLPEHRYPTVTSLCDDLERHLQGLPIRARRTWLVTRASRYVRRRPVHAVAAALALLTLLVTAFWFRMQSVDGRRQEELRSAVSDRIAVAREQWSDGDPEAAFAQLDAAEEALSELPAAPDLQAALLSQRAVFASMQRRWADSADLAQRGLRSLQDATRPDAAVTARLLNTRAYALHRIDPESSQAASRAAHDHARDHLEPGDVLRADALLGWADELRYRGQDDAAQTLLDEAVAEIQRHDPRSELVARFLNDQALAFARRGDLERAAARYREALQVLTWHRGEGHPAVGKVRFNLGATLYRAREFAAARAAFERTLTTWRETGDTWFLAATQQMLGRTQFREGRLDAAEAAAREALELREDLGDPGLILRSRCLLAIVRAARGEADEAHGSLSAVLAASNADTLPAELEADAHRALGQILADAGRSAEARHEFEAALRILREMLGPDHDDCAALERRVQDLR